VDEVDPVAGQHEPRHRVFGRDAHGDGALLGKTATLELEPTEVETVVAAERSGALSLSLRSAADFTDDPVSPVDAGLKALAAAMLDAELAKRATPPAKGAPLLAKPAVVAAELPAPDENLLIRVRRGAADVQTVTLN
jgi:hypothetical protein